MYIIILGVAEYLALGTKGGALFWLADEAAVSVRSIVWWKPGNMRGPLVPVSSRPPAWSVHNHVLRDLTRLWRSLARTSRRHWPMIGRRAVLTYTPAGPQAKQISEARKFMNADWKKLGTPYANEWTPPSAPSIGASQTSNPGEHSVHVLLWETFVTDHV